jgi:hypothetical protein
MSFRTAIRISGLCASAALLAVAPAAAVKRRAFVTSVSGSGNLSSWPDAGGNVGLAAGDAICRARAAAGGLPNASAYRAWLSTAATDAWCHVQGLSGERATGCGGGAQTGGGPWYLANGITPWTGSLAELATSSDPEIYRGVLQDEFGVSITSFTASTYWTGTSPEGAGLAGTCTDWTQGSPAVFGGYGTAFGAARAWSFLGSDFCDDNLRLLCLEPGPSETPLVRWFSPGSVVFVTSVGGTGNLGSWPQAQGATGIAAGDAICRNVAAAAHLPAPSSFVAWLSAPGVDAADRVTSNGPFKRIDGLVVASSHADLTDGTVSVSVQQTELGDYGVTGWSYVWTGTAGDGGHSTPDCDAWQDGTSGSTGRAGHLALERYEGWTENAPQGCQAQRSLYCFSNVVTIFWDGFDLTGDAGRWSSVTP